jgi:hypothetical protein
LSLKNRLLDAIVNEFAPEVAKSALNDLLSNKTKEEVYSFLCDHDADDWYNLIPEKAKQAIRRIKPTDLSWCNPKWVIETVRETNPAVASLILGSPRLQSILNDKLEKLKRRIHEAQF